MRTEAQDPRELDLGKYKIIEPLKTGGTAAIYLAVMRGENNFSREVVVKRPLPHLLVDRQLRSMFIDEAHIASRLAHPNIIQVIDLVANDDDVFLVLEYLRGRDLREVLRRSTDLGRLVPQELSAWIGAEISAGLDFAHDATTPDGQKLNLVHRDVSPKNIRITDRGVVKVIDFGIARADHRISETAPGSVKGTLGYMSPEQVMGEAIDRRSDIFSFGICFYQMLTGRNPFDASSLKDRIHKLINAPIPTVREFNPNVDPRLEAVAMRCLERDVEVRYARMRDVQDELERFLADVKLASPRQRLVDYLEEIFPDIHELPQRLQEVLSTMSGLTNRASGGRSIAPVVAEVRAASAASLPPDAPLEATAPMPGQKRPDEAEPSLGAWSAWADPPAQSFRISAPPASAPSTDHSGISAVVTETAAPPAKRDRPWALYGASLILATGAIAVLVYVFGPKPPEGPSVVTLSNEELAQGTPEDQLPVAPVSADAGAVAEPGPAPALAAKTKVERPEVKQKARPSSQAAPRELLRTGVHLTRRGRLDDALLVYRLAHARSGSDVDPAIFRNLALVHRELGEAEKVRACFNMYLSLRPSADDASRIRALVAGYPATKAVPCVSDAEEASAVKIGRRAGARIETWIAEAQSEP